MVSERPRRSTHTQACNDNAFIHHAATGDDADCICYGRHLQEVVEHVRSLPDSDQRAESVARRKREQGL